MPSWSLESSVHVIETLSLSLSSGPLHSPFAGWVLCCLLLVRERTRSPSFLSRLSGCLSVAGPLRLFQRCLVLLIPESLGESVM